MPVCARLDDRGGVGGNAAGLFGSGGDGGTGGGSLETPGPGGHGGNGALIGNGGNGGGTVALAVFAGVGGHGGNAQLIGNGGNGGNTSATGTVGLGGFGGSLFGHDGAPGKRRPLASPASRPENPVGALRTAIRSAGLRFEWRGAKCRF